MNLILLEGREIGEGGRARLSDHRAKHLLRVLKAGPGQLFRVGILDGPMGEGRVVRIEGEEIELACAFAGTASPPPRVDLLLALPRPKVMKRLWAQLSAMGVGRIILTNAEKVERDYFDTHVLSPECYRPLLMEGLQQARDTWMPVVSIHKQFKILVEDELDGLIPDALRVVADPSGTRSAQDVMGTAERVLLAVGPEGGWNEFEKQLLAHHGFTSVSMGPRTLRTDTACISLLALVHDALRAH